MHASGSLKSKTFGSPAICAASADAEPFRYLALRSTIFDEAIIVLAKFVW